MDFKEKMKTITDDQIILKLKNLGVLDVILNTTKTKTEALSMCRKIINVNPSLDWDKALEQNLKVQINDIPNAFKSCSLSYENTIVGYSSNQYLYIGNVNRINTKKTVQTYETFLDNEGNLQGSNIEYQRTIETAKKHIKISRLNDTGLAQISFYSNTSPGKAKFISKIENPEPDSFDKLDNKISAHLFSPWDIVSKRFPRKPNKPNVNILINYIEDMSISKYKEDFLGLLNGDDNNTYAFYPYLSQAIVELRKLLPHTYNENVQKEYTKRFISSIYRFLENENIKEKINKKGGLTEEAKKILNKYNINLNFENDKKEITK